MMKRRGTVIVLSLAAIMMMGCEKKEDSVLDRAQARAIISKYLEDPQYDVKISVDIEHDTPLIADVVGGYQNKIVAVKYDKEMISTAPKISPNIDYFLEFPPGKEPYVKAAMESLKDAKFTPVLAQKKDLGAMLPFRAIRGSFRVRSASKGECRIDDQDNAALSTFVPKRRGIDLFAIPDNSGFDLNGGEYSIVCSFSNKENLSIEDLPVMHFTLSLHELPQYKGGLKDINCSMGTQKSLDAQFTPKGNTLDVVYYRDNSLMKSNTFKCDQVGNYAVKAIATDENGLKAESPKVTIQVADVPEGFFEGDGGDGESY